MRRLMIASLSALLVGCSTVDYDFSDVAPKAQPSTMRSSGGMRFADTDPHEWEGGAPWHYAVHGTDVAKYQADIDWKKVARNDISFAFIKATEGGDIVDDYFARNWRAAKAAGVPRGAYHFFYHCRPAIEQARWFIRNVPRDASALPPVLDMEWTPFSPTCTIRPPAEKVRSEMRIFLNAVERHYGKRPIIYTSIDFFDDNDLSSFKGYPFWLRSVAGHPDDKYSDHPWVFWQYTGTGVIPGIEGKADINVFNGNSRAWKNWLRANAS